MLHRLKLFAIAISALGFSLTAVTADEALMDGIRPFICDGEAIVFLDTDKGWVISTSPTAEVKSTDNGWRFEDTLSGDVWYLREESRNSWVIDGVSENGHFQADCIDLADSVSQVVTTIKPRLDQAILGTERELGEAKFQLSKEFVENADLRAENKSLRKALLDAEAALDAEKAKYSALRFAAVKGSSAAPFIRDLLEMAPSKRNAEINNSNLLKAINGSGMLPICVRTLRDKAKLSEKCEEAIVDFLLVEGWQ